MIYCRKPGHFPRGCRERIEKKQEQSNNPSLQNAEPSTSKTFKPSPHCQKTIHHPGKYCDCPNAANRPKKFK